ncbi:MAG: endopeptidase La [Eubacteriales bacterium]|nr:endopeptidase La [Eubacteriales bacterium]
MLDKMMNLPMVPLRGLVIFPHMVLNFEVGRERSVTAVDTAVEENTQLFLTTQKELRCEDPGMGDLYTTGVVARVKQVVRTEDGALRLIVEGIQRAELLEIIAADPYMEAYVRPLPEPVISQDDTQAQALMRTTVELFERYAAVSSHITPEMLVTLVTIQDVSELADTAAAQVVKRLSQRQELLDMNDPIARLEKLQGVMAQEIEIARMEQSIGRRVKEQMDQNQKEYYLHEQLKAIQTELGEDAAVELEDFRAKLKGMDLPKEVREKISKEISRIDKLPPNSPESPMMRSYVEWMLELPWGKLTADNLDIANAKEILDEDHYGLERVKERVLEYLAVKSLTKSMKGPILCFVGPPGVGKTSIGKSIARATGRSFVRMSLGGVHDEAEIRGHRKTYIGAMPGRIVSSVKQAGTMNPVFLLDEVDKMASDFRGDPASAMLEVLDSAQNDTFRDHYLEVPFDLSKVMFLATANTLDTIPGPLRDRMEIIEIEGYTDEEKLHIARRHLLGKQMKEHGLADDALEISDDVLRHVISGYTREAGVRALERQIAKICRKAARTIAEKKVRKVRVTRANLVKMLGQPRYWRDEHSKQDEVGVATGLAWTTVGGEILSIEVNTMPGKGKLELTGQLGDVMKESAMAAYSYIRAHAAELGVPEDFHEKLDVHVHVPEGATPKDGPSAGITMTTALVSALSGKKVSGRVAMTGEITLRGRVLPIGGLKEKVLAAYREGIEQVLIPKDNVKDVEEIPRDIRSHVDIEPVSNIREVLDRALVR